MNGNVNAMEGAGGWLSYEYLLKLGRFGLIYYLIGVVMKPMLAPSPASPPFTEGDESKHGMVNNGVGYGVVSHEGLFNRSHAFDLQIFLSENFNFSFNSPPVFVQQNILYDWRKEGENELSLAMNFTLSDELKANKTCLFAHIFFSVHYNKPVEINPSHSGYDNELVFSKTVPLIVYKKKAKKSKARLLLSSEESVNENKEEDIEKDLLEEETGELVPHWRPDLHVCLVLDFFPKFGRNQVPASILPYLTFTSPNETYFYPVIYDNDFWQLSKNLIPINSSISTVPLKIQYSPISLWKWNLQVQYTAQNEVKSKMGLAGSSDRENDMLKEILTDTNPWLLGITMLVSVLHMVFDMLAFKNDIQFWRNKKNMAGTSTRTMLINCFFQTIILLYLFDNETSSMVLFSSSIGILYFSYHFNTARYYMACFIAVRFGHRVLEGGESFQTATYLWLLEWHIHCLFASL